jgi:hypothetical protein
MCARGQFDQGVRAFNVFPVRALHECTLLGQGAADDESLSRLKCDTHPRHSRVRSSAPLFAAWKSDDDVVTTFQIPAGDNFEVEP